MTDITANRENVTIEETKYKASISEATAQKIGGSLNFVNLKQYDTHTFNLNGVYELGVGSTGLDGMFICLINMELVAITISNEVSGVSGTTTVDIDWFNGSGSNQGTIFSTKPSIDSTSPNDAYGIKGIATGFSDFGGTGITLPVMSKTTFNAGDALNISLDTAMSSAQNLAVSVHFRPIN